MLINSNRHLEPDCLATSRILYVILLVYQVFRLRVGFAKENFERDDSIENMVTKNCHEYSQLEAPSNLLYAEEETMSGFLFDDSFDTCIILDEAI